MCLIFTAIVTINTNKLNNKIFEESIKAIKASSLDEYKWTENTEPLPMPRDDEMVDITEVDPDELVKQLRTLEEE